MQKNSFTIVEVAVVFLLILGVTFFVLPMGFNTTKQASLISQWAQKYSEFEYMFTVIKAQQDSELKEKFNKAKNNNAKKNVLLETIKPYLRIKTPVDKVYIPTFMNKQEIKVNDEYYFKNFYYTDTNEIVGLKWNSDNCNADDICANISIDINGHTPPNKWGYDIFGINVFKNRIEPIGKNIQPNLLRTDCAKRGSGVYCSYYYLTGGRFD